MFVFYSYPNDDREMAIFDRTALLVMLHDRGARFNLVGTSWYTSTAATNEHKLLIVVIALRFARAGTGQSCINHN